MVLGVKLRCTKTDVESDYGEVVALRVRQKSLRAR
jgi:hypothetical protein